MISLTKTQRDKLAKDTVSRNPLGQPDGYRTTCGAAVLNFFDIPRSKYRYCQTIDDLLRILRRKGHSATNCSRVLLKGSTIPGNRKNLQKHFGLGTLFVAKLPNHVVLLDGEGDILVDTDKPKRDKRTLENIWRIRCNG